MSEQLPQEHREKLRKLLGKRKPSDTLAREIDKAAASCERGLLSPTAKDRQRRGPARKPSISWLRKHPYCVEECDILTPDHYLLRWKYLPDMVLVARRDGVAMKYYLVCRKCNHSAEYLTLVPEEGAEWACRICNGLVYASQRYKNPKHPLRLLPTPRQRRERFGGVFSPHCDT